MWAGSPPKVTAEDAARACARGVGEPELRQRVLGALTGFEQNSQHFQDAVFNDKLHEVEPGRYAVTGLNDVELVKLYVQQFSKIGKFGRPIYDRILTAAPHGRCIYCRHNLATTLDHFVPKAHVPGLAIDPWNLVPACSDCNHGLSSGYSEHAAEQMLHPYAMPDLGDWLHATVEHTKPVSIQFRAVPDGCLSAVLQARIEYQFGRLKLAGRYRLLCSGDLSSLAAVLTGVQFKDAGSSEVQLYLADLAHLFGDDPNDRRAVMYRALAADNWYCEGGYAEAFFAE